jgi:hypothetical protein
MVKDLCPGEAPEITTILLSALPLLLPDICQRKFSIAFLARIDRERWNIPEKP